jgi:asparagine synthase (glutamine-hydrolysing)
LDLTEAGHQPMPYADKRYWIVFNGEIYNFLELRQQLESLGHRFRTESDTEVILASYVQWGQDCQFKFNGMWAFAIWDNVDRRLFLSRDRFGVKPLFFFSASNWFLFASELKAFMSLPRELRPEFDPRMVARMKNEERFDQTLLKGVVNLNAGCCLTLKYRGRPEIRKWWTTSENLEQVPNNFEEQVERYKEIFVDACRIRMRSDVPIGTALSGGLDSSSTLCTMSEIRNVSHRDERLAQEWQKAFVLVYADTTHDERRHAEAVIRHTGAVPIFKEIQPVDISSSDIEKAIYGFEAIQSAEPSIGPWLIYQEMRKAGVLVSIDGLGGDETLAGYHEYLPIAMKDAIWPIPKPQRWNELHLILSGLYEDAISEGSKPYVPTVQNIVNSFVPGIPECKAMLFPVVEKYPWLLKQLRSYLRFIRNSLTEKGKQRQESWLHIDPARPTSNFRERNKMGWNYLQQYLYDDFHYGTNARSLRNFDRMSMSHGIESRAPFMDWRLVCYAFALPSESKLGEGFTKYILREAMRGVLPERIRIRKSKLGFSSPMPVWYRYGIKSQVLDVLNSREFLESDIWNGHAIRDYTETCYRKEDYVEAVKSWKFIQAYSLMNSFEKAAYREKR